MITEDAILNFIPTRVSGTGFSASQFQLKVSIKVPDPVPVPFPAPVPDSGFRLFHTPSSKCLFTCILRDFICP